MITPPARTSSLVVDRMSQLIRDGQWPMGTRIPSEPELVELFGVGRNTIREAVRALEHAGLLAPRRGDGTYVCGRNPLAGAISRCTPDPEITDLITTRRALESEAAALAAQHADADTVTGLKALLADTVAALDAGDVERYALLDLEFHSAVVTASRNPLLIELYDGIGEVMRRNHRDLADATSGTGHPRGHHDVVEAIADADPARARDAVHRYLETALDVTARDAAR
nr:FCD domain-containing protein [Gordonia desulfuricans]